MSRRTDDDDCSYISRMPEPDCTSQFGCLMTGAAAVVILAILIFCCCGCSTCYVSLLRQEYREAGEVKGIYYGSEEYPAIYPATKIATRVEIPSWWWNFRCSPGWEYHLFLWPMGAAMSLVDVPISIVTDTLMLPYDLIQSIK